MVKQLIIIVLSFFISNQCLSSISESHLFICYSANGEYKLVVSPTFCNEVNCLTLDEIDSLKECILPEFLSQTIYVYKKDKAHYVKVASYEIPKDNIYLDIPSAQYFISNDGNTVILEDKQNIRWHLLKLDSPLAKIKEFRVENLFDFSLEQYEKCLGAGYNISKSIKKTCRIQTKVKDSLKIKARYFSIKKGKFICKKTEISFI